MKVDEQKMVLKSAKVEAVKKAHEKIADEFLKPEKQLPNVNGLGVGVKWKNGIPTGEPALIVFVTQKLPKNELRRQDIIPPKLADMQTDVLSIGQPIAGGGPSQQMSSQTLAERIRPVEGGYSVGHKDITAGTVGTCVYDILPEGTVSPPKTGIGKPRKYYILSNNHVLAKCNEASIGDPILQPGSYDGGTYPDDKIATLSRYIHIHFGPVPHPRLRNIVDAAVAEGEFHDLDREIYWIGYVRGWRTRDNVEVGTLVQKTGRTTNYTIGRITAVSGTVDVSYGAHGVARFYDQIITTCMSAGGDSGSLVTTLGNVAVGLLFAGSSQATIANQIQNVRSRLRVEIAEQIL